MALGTHAEPVALDAERIEAFEERAMRWLAEHAGYFDPETYARGDRAGRLAAMKALVDLASLLRCRAILSDAPPSDEYLALLDVLHSVAARPSYRELIAKQHRAIWLFGVPYAALRAWGRDDAELRWLMEQAAGDPYTVSWERLPYRHLDYLRFLSAGGLPAGDAQISPRSFAQAFELTLLRARPNLLELTEDDVYAITHTVFYMTDYGLEPDYWPAGFDVGDAAELICALLRDARVRRHSDLIAELLISLVCLTGSAASEVGRAWQKLFDLEGPAGGIAAPPHQLAGLVTAQRGEAGYAEWRSCNHTTIVSLIAALVTLRAMRVPQRPAQPLFVTSNQARTKQHTERWDAAMAGAVTWLAGAVTRCPISDALIAAAGVCAFAEQRGDGAIRLDLANVIGTRLRDAPEIDIVPDACAPGAELLPALLRALPQHSRERDLLEQRLSARGVTDSSEGSEALVSGSMPDALRNLGGAPATVLLPRTSNVDAATVFIESLAAGLIDAWREHRLGDLAVILRALGCAGAGGDRSARDAKTAVLTQQRVDGSFGYPSTNTPESERIRLTWTARLVAV